MLIDKILFYEVCFLGTGIFFHMLVTSNSSLVIGNSLDFCRVLVLIHKEKAFTVIVSFLNNIQH